MPAHGASHCSLSEHGGYSACRHDTPEEVSVAAPLLASPRPAIHPARPGAASALSVFTLRARTRSPRSRPAAPETEELSFAAYSRALLGQEVPVGRDTERVVVDVEAVEVHEGVVDLRHDRPAA